MIWTVNEYGEHQARLGPCELEVWLNEEGGWWWSLSVRGKDYIEAEQRIVLDVNEAKDLDDGKKQAITRLRRFAEELRDEIAVMLPVCACPSCVDQ